jgi:methylmalonyl-CoA mutase N-terminal domain/subunit
VSLTAQQPENNIARVAYQGLAAVLGGTQSLHTNALDETLALPTEKAVRIALRTQQILAYETGVPNTIDPLAGSYYVEWLTDRTEEDAERIFAEIDEMGGVVKGIEEGYFQGQIALSAERFQHEVETNQRIVVGVNDFTGGNEDLAIDLLRIGPEIEEKQRQRLTELRARRNQTEVDRALERLAEAAENDENLMGPMLDAVRVYATLGEIRHALERIYGRFREPLFF